MAFVRPKTGSREGNGPNYLLMFGAADDRDGRALDELARALRLIASSWIAIMAARTAMMTVLAGGGRMEVFAQNTPFLLLLALAILCDALIVASNFIAPVKALSPNRQLLAAAPLVLISSAIYHLSAAATLSAQPAALLAATLGPAMVAMVIFGRRHGLALAYGVGGLLVQIVAVPDFQLAAPVLLLVAGTALVAFLEWRIERQSAEFMHVTDHVLTGEQAKALLADFEKSGHGWFWETDRNAQLTYISETLAAQLGCKAFDLIGKPIVDLMAQPPSGTGHEGQRSLAFHLSARTAFSDISVLAAHTRDERWWSISGQPVVTPFGQFLGFRGSGNDLTEMRRSQAEVARLATVDSLTGLANRSQMLQSLEQALNAQRGIVGECAMFLLDLDRFKEVNDTMGHPAGDALLRQVAQRLLRLVGNRGKVGRIGGDEFQIVLPGMLEPGPLSKLADAIIFSLSEPYVVDGSQVIIGASIGIALSPVDGANSETLIRNADLALYAAKADGRGQYRFFVPAMHAEAEDRRQLEADLRLAINSGGLHIEYQPGVCASSERITSFESLIRWNHPTRGPISPAAFIPVAEDAGLISAVGEWVLRTACADAVKWPAAIRVAVNVSPIQFANPAFPKVVLSALANSGLAPERLELEITESVFLSDRDNTDAMFAQLKGLGVRLALDDFGTGYSALGYLKTAPFDKIKIDQSFVRGAAIRGSRNAAIVKSIVNLGEALGMETTAEGAETLDELDLIRSLGCSHVQGYVYGRPMAIDKTLTLLSEQGGHAVAQGHKSSREPRMTMLRTIVLAHAGNRYTARIRNISASGAMVEGLLDVPAGTEFAVEFDPQHVVKGLCRWSRGDRMGIEFETAISVERVRNPERPQASTTIHDAYRVRRTA
jgi:diguanylate cyclase (GGDEF)-like protein